MVNLLPRKFKQKIILSGISLVTSFVAFEIIIRLLIVPSQLSYGTLFGHELPPFKVVPPSSLEPVNLSEWYNDLIVDGKRITIGDLSGAYKDDSLMGYTPLENWSSENVWWINNDLGARAEEDFPINLSQNKTIILIFGNSFAVATGNRQEEIWSNIIQTRNKNTVIQNFAVPGYGMGQSALRYQQIDEKFDYDIVLLMFVPSADLWRDINVIRPIGEEGWTDYRVLPRFTLEGNQLHLISSVYQNPSDIYIENAAGASDLLREHLIKHDRFYFPKKYEETPLLDNSIMYKLIIKIFYDQKRRIIHRTALNPDSEALLISQAIFNMMENQANEANSKFVLIILPTHSDLESLVNEETFARKWNQMVESTCKVVATCVDLTTPILQANPENLDYSFDGTHYGPKANNLIASIVQSRLEEIGLLDEN